MQQKQPAPLGFLDILPDMAWNFNTKVYIFIAHFRLLSFIALLYNVSWRDVGFLPFAQIVLFCFSSEIV